MDTSVATKKVISPPRLTGEFLMANMSLMRDDWLTFLTRCAQEYGGIVHINLLGIQMYLVSDADYIEEVLGKRHRSFIKDKTLRSYPAIYGNGLLTSEGDFWLSQRRLAQPPFHRERMAAYSEVMVAYTERMLKHWRAGETHDVHWDMRRLTLEILSKTLFGVEVPDDEAQDQKGSRLFGVDLDGENWLQAVDQVIFNLIRQRRAREAGQNLGDLLSMLMEAQYEDGTRMSDQQLRDEVITLLMAGHDTSTLVLAWTFYFLAQHPEAEAKLVAELKSVLGGRSPTMADLPQLPYTEWVIKETMRVYPPVWGFGREAIEDCEIGGYRIPKGATVFMSEWVVQRHPRYFDQPETYNPDRWRDDLAKRLPPYAYFPFGGGPRLCIGYAYSMVELVLIMATLAQKFRWTLAPEPPVTLKPGLTLQPGNGIHVVLANR
jgi:cytochrome P450